MSKPATILFVTSTRIGDAVLSSGVLAHLIAAHPGAAVTVVAGGPSAPLFAAVPGLERLIVLEKKPLSLHWLWLLKEIGMTRWDVLVDLRAAPLLRLVRASKHYHLGKTSKTRHRVQETAAVIGLADHPPAPRLWLSDADRAKAETLIRSDTPILAIGPIANWKPKTWAPENFAALIARITGPDGFLPGAKVAFFGHQSEREKANAVLQSVAQERRIDLVGELTLGEVGACLARCAFFVGNDSGLMHMAAASGIPTLGLFGPSRETLYAPFGARGAFVRPEKSFEDLMGGPVSDDADLMAGLGVEKAFGAASSLWQKTSGLSS